MNTVTGLLAKYTLSGGDTVYVDTGVYTNQMIYVAANDSGSWTSGYMTVQGSTNYAAGGTVFDYPGAYIIYINGANYVRVNDVTARRGEHGVNVNSAASVELNRVKALNNTYGFRVEGRRGC